MIGTNPFDTLAKMPLECIPIKLIMKYLVEYLENIEPNQVKLAILKGMYLLICDGIGSK